MSFIVLGDSAGKLMAGGGIAPFFVAWSRFALGALFLLPFCGLKREELAALLDWRLWLRALFIICAICSILTALRTEPIANVFGGFFISPIVSYFMSAWLLKERISYRRTGLLLFSFLGVLLVVKPGFGMTAGMGFAMLAGCCHGFYLVATRWLAGSFRPRFLLLSQLLIGGLLLAPLGITHAASEIDWWLCFLVTASAICSAAGNYLLVVVNRTTPASLVAPLIYSQLLAATLFGYVIFGDWPDWLSLIGLVVIISGGFSSLWFARRGQ